MADIENIRVGDLFLVNRDGLCIKKGTIVEVRSVDADNTLPEKGLFGCVGCRPLDDRQCPGGVWAAYLDPVPLSAEILRKNGFKAAHGFGYSDAYPTYSWGKMGTRYSTSVDVTVYEPAINWMPFLVKCQKQSRHEVGINQFHSCDVESVHELQHLMKDCGIDKKIEI